LREFGFTPPELSEALLLQADNIVRMGLRPFRIEVLTSVSGVEFETCYAARVVDIIDGVNVNIISLPHLKTNKQASGRDKDLVDLRRLP